MKTKRLILVLACLMPAFACQARVSAHRAVAGRIITVDENGPADFNNIQAAIDDANDGDVVLIADGIYTGDGNRDIDFKGKAITVRSQNGPGNCIIDCEGSRNELHRGFYFHSGEEDNSVLDGVTVTSAYCGILCDRCSPKVRNCIIAGSNITAPYTGGSVGISTFRSDVLVSNCIITGNAGDGFLCCHGYPVLHNCVVYGNRTRGVACDWGQGVLRLENCIIAGNATAMDRRIQVSAGGCTSHPGCMDVQVKNCCIEDEPNAIFVEAWSSPGFIRASPPVAEYIKADPEFADSGYWDSNGTPTSYDDIGLNGDYHLKSQACRWDPASKSWVQDDVTSPCIDAGNPTDPVGSEPFPNGGSDQYGCLRWHGGGEQVVLSWAGL
jgi:hypothetical protein